MSPAEAYHEKARECEERAARARRCGYQGRARPGRCAFDLRYTPVISRTATGGGFHAWYRYSDDTWKNYGGKKPARRAIRPAPTVPFDFLGAGMAVVPPSILGNVFSAPPAGGPGLRRVV
jgi:hypothetical protein